jgi:hypothetical protein
MRLPFGVADQIETITEPGASRKGFAGAHESTAALGMPEEGSRVRVLYAYSRKIHVDWAFQKLVDRFLNHLFDGKPLLGSDDFQLLQGPLRNR